MEAKLVKEYGNFYLISDKEIQKGDEYVKLDNRPRMLLLGTTIASAKVSKLSLKNCEAIANGYDLDELAISTYPFDGKADVINAISQQAFIKGFQKALEILGDKKFTFDQMLYVAGYAVGLSTRSKLNPSIDIKQEILDFIDKMEQTEWDVEIVEVENDEVYSVSDTMKVAHNKAFDGVLFKYDADGCLILKRKV